MRLGKRSSEGLYAELCAGVPEAKYACWLLERRFPKRWGRHHGEFGEMKRRLRDLERQLDALDPAGGGAGDD